MDCFCSGLSTIETLFEPSSAGTTGIVVRRLVGLSISGFFKVLVVPGTEDEQPMFLLFFILLYIFFCKVQTNSTPGMGVLSVTIIRV